MKNKLANASLRQRVAEEKAAVKKDKPKGKPTAPKGSQPPPETVLHKVQVGLKNLGEKGSLSVIAGYAEKHGHKLVGVGVTVATEDDRVGQIKTMFGHATGAQQMEIVTWAAKEVGVELKDGFEAPGVSADLDEGVAAVNAMKDKAKAKGSRRKAA